MNIEEFREYCLSQKRSVESMPFVKTSAYRGPVNDNLVIYSVGGKWFAVVDIEKRFFNVKCESDYIAELLERYEGAVPAWHMNKKYWISICLESDVPDNLIKELIVNSYKLVIKGLKKSIREDLDLL